jgi:CHAT domain-containing protein
MEEYTISYISAGRDIVRFTDTNIAKGDALIIADPDYDMGLMERDKMSKEMKVAKTIRGGLSKDVLNISFDRLPETKQEADAIEKILKNKKKLKVRNYQNTKAIEEMIFSAETPKILHLATHGYFLNDEELKGSSETRGITIKLKEDFMAKDEAVNIENPMLRSGIVFSGVNASLKAGRDEGMMSAEKILGLNLKGTDLVVLSACETGVGDVKNGEGVFGLKRAFILSGAKTLVMSLWSVPSAETTELMTDFYTLMSTGKPKAEALRQAKLNMMKKKQNPFYWGAFVMTGKPE